MEALLSFLKQVHPLSKEAENALLQICSVQIVAKNENLQPIGHTCRNIYFIKKGLLRIYYLKDGNDITERFEAENAILARADSLFNASPSRKGIQAIETTTVIAINSAKLFALYDQHHDIERLFRKLFEQAYVQTVNRLESLQFYTAEERYNNLLKSSAQIIQRAPLKHIASFLGITQVSLSRIRSKK